MAELQYIPEYTHEAFGKNTISANRSRHPWPFEALSIGHSMASFQSYGWGQAYFHHGIDIRGDEGTPIYAAVGGKVVNVANYYKGSRYYWEVAILDEQGYLWQYHHVDPDSIPQKIKIAFKEKASVPTGELLGEIVDWPVSTFGEVYTHIHLNVLGKDGIYLNPLHFLESLQDIQKPDDELIFALLIKNLSDRQITIEKKLVNYIVKRIHRSYSKIFDFIYKIDEMSLKKKKSISLEIIKASVTICVGESTACIVESKGNKS